MVDQNTTNQDNYTSVQEFTGNIKTLYKDFINPNVPGQKGIDNFRSKISISGHTKDKIIEAITNDTFRDLCKAEKTYQESRCHAFYRIVGFPVYNGAVGETNFYNPGLDHTKKDPEGNPKQITSVKKRQIAADALKYIENFIEISDAREAIPNNFSKIFELNQSLDASVLAISSAKPRLFMSPMNNVFGNAFTVTVADATYNIDSSGKIGNYKKDFKEYISSDGSTPKSSFLSTRSHIIAPFLVDPRYSESVNVENMVSVPFVLTETQLKASETETVEIPLLEAIITNRISTNNLQGTEGQLQVIKKYIQNDPSISDNSLVQAILTDYKLTEQQQFLEFINMMKAMLVELVKAQKAIDEVQKKYYWLPIPSTTGPEFGVSVRPIIISESLANNPIFITELDYQLIVATIEKTVNQTAASKGESSIKRRQVFPLVAKMFNPQISGSAGSATDNNVNLLTSQRDIAMKRAGEALQSIEMIMGEFSGLGLCDILAIIASLYIMPMEQLLGLLDVDAFFRMKAILSVPDAVRDDNLENCLTELTVRVTEFYNLMDKLYEDLRINNGLS